MFLFNFSELFRKAVFLTGLFDLSRPGSRQRQKVNLYSYFHTSQWCLKRFYENASLKPFEAPQRSVK